MSTGRGAPLAGAFKHSNDRLSNDRAAAQWHTSKPGPQSAVYISHDTSPGAARAHHEYLMPGNAARGSDRWVQPPHVIPIDKELQHFGQVSPRRRAAYVTPSMCDSATSVGMGTVGSFSVPSSTNESPRSFHRRNFDSVQTADADDSPLNRFGTSISLPSMSGTSPTGARLPLPLPDDAGLVMSPHRRGANFAAVGKNGNFERNLWPTGMPVPPPSQVGEQLKSFEQWMAAQALPNPTYHNKSSFAERLHQEGQAAQPTPFTHGVHLSPRNAHFPREPEGKAIRQHHNELWPVGERTSHPRVGANTEMLQNGTNMGMPTLSTDPMWGGVAITSNRSPAGSIRPPAQDPNFRHQSSDLTVGYLTSGNTTGWSLGGSRSTVRESLQDASYTGPPITSGSPAGSVGASPEAYRRGRSDLPYIGSNRREIRQEYFAREREISSGAENFSYRRTGNNVTVPGFDDQRERKNQPPAPEASFNSFSSDIHIDASPRAYRLQQAAARRSEARAVPSHDARASPEAGWRFD